MRKETQSVSASQVQVSVGNPDANKNVGNNNIGTRVAAYAPDVFMSSAKPHHPRQAPAVTQTETGCCVSCCGSSLFSSSSTTVTTTTPMDTADCCSALESLVGCILGTN
jgi:hypothetical protein